MAYVIRFQDYQPGPRDDGIKWVGVSLQWSAASAGPWTEFDTKVILDYPDALDPPVMNFTTELAPTVPAWYRLVFKDSTGDTQDTSPSLFKGGPAYRPSTRDVALHIKNRTVDNLNNYLGDFTDDTAVTAEEVGDLILKAEELTLRALDQDPDVAIPDESVTAVRGLIALLAACLVELTKFSEQVARGVSPYPQLKELWDEQLTIVQEDLGVPQTGGGRLSGTSMTAWYLIKDGQFGEPQYDFPTEPTVGWSTKF